MGNSIFSHFSGSLLGIIISNTADKRQGRKNPDSKTEESAGPTTQQMLISLGELRMISLRSLKLEYLKRFTCFNTILKGYRHISCPQGSATLTKTL